MPRMKGRHSIEREAFDALPGSVEMGAATVSLPPLLPGRRSRIPGRAATVSLRPEIPTEPWPSVSPAQAKFHAFQHLLASGLVADRASRQTSTGWRV